MSKLEPTQPGAVMKVGILSGKEIFSEGLRDAINERGGGLVRAEFLRLFDTRMYAECPYRVIVDRISHCVPYYRTYLKNAALRGAWVINNPFWFSADDKFYNYSLATRLGVPVPRTVCLPSKEYDEVLEVEDLENLGYPLNWDDITGYVGFPAILKPYDGYAWRAVTRVDNMDELMSAYNESGDNVMMLQEFIEYEHYVRCFVFGRKYVLPIKYDPSHRQYIIHHHHLSDELGARIVEYCLTLNQALGYDMNTVEFAIRDGVPYAIDFMNPVPDANPRSITDEYYAWVVEHMAKVCIEAALSGAGTPYQLR